MKNAIKNGVIGIVGTCTITIMTAVAGRVGGWLWDEILKEKADNLVAKFKKSKKMDTVGF